ncbi:hypothetical protein M5K25_011424 [Dendrobium thyrsiflorum]|uniref:Uncharacterized protein n=1 Tax=Dendrobium thyrsiflorum TaxID=117978 RepID=A0ABD0V311_DENTH
MKNACLKHYLSNEEKRKMVNIELAKFFDYLEDFGDQKSLCERLQFKLKEITRCEILLEINLSPLMIWKY